MLNQGEVHWKRYVGGMHLRTVCAVHPGGNRTVVVVVVLSPWKRMRLLDSARPRHLRKLCAGGRRRRWS